MAAPPNIADSKTLNGVKPILGTVAAILVALVIVSMSCWGVLAIHYSD